MSCDNQVYTFAIPGPAGAAGTPGTDGTDGVSAFTTVANYAPASQPTMPAAVQRLSGTTVLGSPVITFADTSTLSAGMALNGAGITASTVLSVDDATHITISSNALASATNDFTFIASVTVNVTSSTAWVIPGMILVIQSWGYMTVVSVPTDSSIVVSNPEDTLLGLYDGNAAATTPLAAGKPVTPGGMQGPAGAASAGALLAANNLSDVASVATSRTNLGLGTAAQATNGIANGNLPPVDTTFTNGNPVFATATGLQTKTPTQARTALGLGTAAIVNTGVADGSVTIVNDAAGLTNGEVVFATATGLESVTAATARSRLGVSTTLAYALIRYQQATTVSGGPSLATLWTQVPLNAEVADQGSNVTILGGQVTLQAGTYRYDFGVTGYQVGNMQGRLYNISDASVIADAYGTVAVADLGGDHLTGLSCGRGLFTIAAVKVIELQYYFATANATNGLGLPGNSGGTEVYSWLELVKE